MEIIRGILLLLYLLLIPLAVRVCFFALSGIMNKDAETAGTGTDCFYAGGALGVFTLAQILYLVLANTGRGLGAYKAALDLSCGALALAAVLLLAFVKSVRAYFTDVFGKALRIGKDKRAAAGMAVLGAALILLCIFLQKMPAESEFYRCAETAATILSDGGFFATDPLTGEAAGGILPDDRVMGLPAFYAALCSHFRVSPLLLFTCLLPVWVVLLVFATVSQIRTLFPSAGGFWLYFTFTAAALFGNTAYRNPFYDLVHMPYEGRTLIAFLLLPLAVLGLGRTAGQSKTAGRKILKVLLYAPAFLLTALFLGGFAEGLFLLLIVSALWGLGLWISRFIF